ncbi:MAG: hypothetical protein ACRD9Y_06970, partial [Blastocatellia bacterium]
RRLIDDYQISYLGAGRDALRFGAASSGQPAAALVAADPDFDLRRRASSGAGNERNCWRRSTRASVARGTNRRFRAAWAAAGDTSGRGAHRQYARREAAAGRRSAGSAHQGLPLAAHFASGVAHNTSYLPISGAIRTGN